MEIRIIPKFKFEKQLESKLKDNLNLFYFLLNYVIPPKIFLLLNIKFTPQLIKKILIYRSV